MQLCFDKVIKDAGYHRLIQDGWLSPFDQYMLGEYSVESVSGAFLSDPVKWGKSMMFFPRIVDCYEAMELIEGGGIKCDVVTGETDRYSQIDRFEAGEVQVLINVYVLTEGFDCPDMQSVFVRDSSRAPTIQMSGRVLRKFHGIPVCNIVQSVLTKHPFVKTAKPNQQFIQSPDGQWLSVGTNDKIEAIRKDMLIRLANTMVTLPDFLLRNLDVGGKFNELMNGTVADVEV